MSIWYTIKDIDDIDISNDKTELEILFDSDFNGNKYVSIPIEMIVNRLENRVGFAEPNQLETGWIDVKKELPNNDRFVIIYWNNGYYNEMTVASYDKLDMKWYDHNRESFTDDVTHWREFPPRP